LSAVSGRAGEKFTAGEASKRLPPGIAGRKKEQSSSKKGVSPSKSKTGGLVRIFLKLPKGRDVSVENGDRRASGTQGFRKSEFSSEKGEGKRCNQLLKSLKKKCQGKRKGKEKAVIGRRIAGGSWGSRLKFIYSGQAKGRPQGKVARGAKIQRLEI